MIKFEAILKKVSMDDDGESTIVLTVPSNDKPSVKDLLDFTKENLVVGIQKVDKV